MPVERSGNNKWADEGEDEEFETKVDSNGYKDRVKVSLNAKGQKIKTTTKIRVREIKTKIPKRVLDRMNLPRFGEALENNVNVTNHSKDFVSIEHPDDQFSEEDPSLGKTLVNFVLKQQERAFEREHDLEGLLEDEKHESTGTESKQDSESKDVTPAGGPGGLTSGKYVPPNLRGATGGASAAGASMGGKTDRDHENTIRVSNLTKRITEDDLRDLFSRFGPIFRISLPRIEKKDEKTGQMVKEPRGFAYVAYQRKDDAIKAMERLQGHGYDHLILKLEWAKPPSNDGPPGGGGLSAMGFVSGYGQKLAQETKEQVSYASNLTSNR